MASPFTLKEVLVKRFQSKHSTMEVISCPYPSQGHKCLWSIGLNVTKISAVDAKERTLLTERKASAPLPQA